MHSQLIEMFSDLGFFEVDPSGKVRDWSDAASRLLGIGPEEVIGRSIPELGVYDHAAAAVESLKAAAKDGRSETFGWVTRKDGSKFWANEVTIPVRDPAGAITGFARVVRDVTAWKIVEEERDRLFMLSPDLICVAGFDGFFKRISPSFTRVLGYSEAELLGKPFVAFIHPDDVAATEHAASTINAGERDAVLPFTNRYRRQDGEYRWLEWKSVADIPTERVYAVARDVTEQMATDRKLKDYATELERSNGELQTFAYVASHDLQEPLRAVAGCVQMLADRLGEKLDEKSTELVGHAVEGAKRMQALINDLLAYSRVGSKGISKKWLDPRPTVERAMKQLEAAMVESGAVVRIGDLPRVWADGVQLTQLFQNLLGNAIKFRGKKRVEIDICAEAGITETTFWIRDNGIGIEPAYHERIFGLFQRLNRRSEYAGTGIGLAICKKIVESHGGRILVESEAGQGATFNFTIPNERGQ
jgi:PAS domain S-box-containing protein